MKFSLDLVMLIALGSVLLGLSISSDPDHAVTLTPRRNSVRLPSCLDVYRPSIAGSFGKLLSWKRLTAILKARMVIRQSYCNAMVPEGASRQEYEWPNLRNITEQHEVAVTSHLSMVSSGWRIEQPCLQCHGLAKQVKFGVFRAGCFQVSSPRALRCRGGSSMHAVANSHDLIRCRPTRTHEVRMR